MSCNRPESLPHLNVYCKTKVQTENHMLPESAIVITDAVGDYLGDVYPAVVGIVGSVVSTTNTEPKTWNSTFRSHGLRYFVKIKSD